jgi:hypothetical protein
MDPMPSNHGCSTRPKGLDSAQERVEGESVLTPISLNYRPKHVIMPWQALTSAFSSGFSGKSVLSAGRGSPRPWGDENRTPGTSSTLQY